MLSWDDAEDDKQGEEAEKDFLLDGQAEGEAPKACPLNPGDEQCDACQ